MNKQALSDIAIIRASGVIGAGGAGFPTYAKLNCQAEYVILNAAECEPLLRVDQQLMAEYPEEILSGLSQALAITGASKALIGIKGKHKQAIEVMREAIEKAGQSQAIEVRVIPDVYPAGDEQILVYELTGRIVPETGIPIQVGCVVINPETAMNIHYAINGKAVTETFLTVAGDVSQPITLKVPVGTPIREVIAGAGVKDLEQFSVIDGGPMMGPVLEDTDGFVTRKSKGYIVLKKDHALIRRKSVGIEQSRRINRAACEQCRMCTDLCPRYLIGHDMQPHKIMQALTYESGAVGELGRQGTAALCSECALCSLFSCPAGLYPKSANGYFKEKLQALGTKYNPAEKSYAAHGFRDYRLVSTKRLTGRLGLKPYDLPAPLSAQTLEPDLVGIALNQHIGAPAQATVSLGDTVVTGQVIGDVPQDKLGVPAHASIPGTVERIVQDCVYIRRKR